MRKSLIWLIFTCTPLLADDDAFRERFADPVTRTASLAELIPGTQTAYFHTALDHQLANRDAEFKQTMGAWKVAAEHKGNPVSANGMDVLENRQLLIDYRKTPQPSLTELMRRLDLRFDDTRPDAAAAESLPTRLDPALISDAAFDKSAAAQAPDKPYTQYMNQRLLRELEHVETFDDAKTRWFLENLKRADLPGVVPLVSRALGLDRALSFNAHSLLSKLTAAQLEALLKLQPDLRAKESFDLAYLAKRRPGTEIDFDRDPKAHADFLRRCRDFVITLPPALNSLKAHVLFHHLRLQAELGNYPKEDFLTYLALPRTRHELLLVPETPAAAPIRLDADYAATTACPPVGHDLPLIQSYLQHLLGLSDSSKDFLPFIAETQLIPLHARARLLAGANAKYWGALLGPAAFRTLQDDARIGFAPGAPILLASDAAVALTLDLKNTPDLLIRIYELDLPAFLARNNTEPDVSIDLDGLVPHYERHLAFTQPPIAMHRETIKLPELAGPGAWLVDFTAGQVSARTLIRKGRLIAYPERTATGQTVRVFDEALKPVTAAATILLGRETFAADAATGRIVIPNAPNQPVTRGTVQAGKLAAPIELESRTDDLALDARFHLEREQLLAGREARLILRVRLTNHGCELPLDRVKDPALVLKAGLLGGVTTERVIAENLTLKPLLEIPFQVPADLLKLTLTLRGTVTPATGGDPEKLYAKQSYELNRDLKQARVATAFFCPTREGHRLEIRGRNGEPLPSRAITLTACRYDYPPDIEIHVRTDANGRVDLGKLNTIDYLKATGTDIAETLYDPKPRTLNCASELQLGPNSDVLLPLAKPASTPDRLELSLLETLAGQPIRDHFDKLAVEDGQLVMRGLPPGDFELRQGDDLTTIRISAGVEKDGLLLSNTRILPLESPRSPTIASASADKGELKIQLHGHGPDTRVSLAGKRYQNADWDAGMGLYRFYPPLSKTLAPGFVGCGFLTERRLSDEMRYILDRRAAKIFPGSLLPRPGLLLKRWTEEDLYQDTMLGKGGADGKGGGAAKCGSSTENTPAKPKSESSNTKDPTVCDFLQMPAVVRVDLTPEADGSIKLPLADFAGCQFIEILADDLCASDSLIVPLAANDTPLRDRRIARPLDPKVHHLATRSAAVLQQGATAAIENLLDADWRAFTTLTEAHQFLYGTTRDERLREFVFLTEWPDLSAEKKLGLLDKHACHEFHLFLARKDKPFFDKHVKPMLAGKPEPRFMDDFLLGRDLSTYLRPYALQRLNAAEKALLGRALPAVRERIARELAHRWELEAPAPDLETTLFTQTLRGSDLAITDSLGLAKRDLQQPEPQMSGNGVAYITEKLRRIIIPKIDFEDVTVAEAIDFLRLRATELDTLELDPSKKGVNFVVRRPRNAIGGSSDPGVLRIPELRLKNVPLAVAIKYICDQTKLRFKTDDFAVTLVPSTECGEDIFTRTFAVPPDFTALLDSGGSADGDADPFATPAPKQARLAARKPVTELLREAGINFPEGSSVTLSNNGVLLVTNTPSELDKIEQLTAAVVHSSARQAGEQTPAAGFSNGDTLPQLGAADEGASSGRSTAADPFAATPEADPFAAPEGNEVKRLTARKPVTESVPLFPNRTRLWREANYYHNTKPTDETLIPLNRFWLDLAAWDGKGPFLSPHFNACATTANEALMCLALLDLPFKAARPEVTVDGSTLRVKAREPMLLFYKDTRRCDTVAKESPLLVRQSFSPLAEPFLTIDGRQVENPVTGDFRPGLAYHSSLTVTNPTGLGRRIDVLAQIPAGAIPLQGKPATLSSTHELKPYGVLMLDMAFYFPAAGEFAVYPLHVSGDGSVLAHTGPRTLRVSNDPAPQDAAAWQVLAGEGSNDGVLDRLRAANLNTLDLKAIRWRLADRGFFLRVTQVLRERLHFSADVASYGFHHNDVASIREYLENSDAVRQLGQWLDSDLLEVRPRVHHDWQTLEFDPLVNARAHRFGDEPRLTHDVAREHYQALLEQLGWKPALDAADQLSLTALLFLQDRIDEALVRFDTIDPNQLPGRLNYDYLHAVALFHREQPAAANAIAGKILPSLPPGLWRDRFQAVVDQAAEIAALDQPDRDKKAEDELCAPQLDLALGDGGKLVIQHRGLGKTTLRLFSVDLEVLFSKNPFLRGEGNNGGNPAIRPNGILVVPLAKDVTETTLDLPEALRNGNVLVAADAGNAKLLKVLDSRAMDLRHLPQERTIQVLDAATGKPLAKTYIKVYAETNGGEIVFHKDGYTDLRGKFDYLSHTGSDPSAIKRLALLASHPEKGARTVIYDR